MTEVTIAPATIVSAIDPAKPRRQNVVTTVRSLLDGEFASGIGEYIGAISYGKDALIVNTGFETAANVEKLGVDLPRFSVMLRENELRLDGVVIAETDGVKTRYICYDNTVIPVKL